MSSNPVILWFQTVLPGSLGMPLRCPGVCKREGRGVEFLAHNPTPHFNRKSSAVMCCVFLDSPSVLFWTKDNVALKRKFEKNPCFTALRHSGTEKRGLHCSLEHWKSESIFNLQVPRTTLLSLDSSFNSWGNYGPEQGKRAKLRPQRRSTNAVAKIRKCPCSLSIPENSDTGFQ